MTNSHAIIAIAIMSAVTAALRFLPFLIFSGRETPRWVVYLGKVLPCAIMGMLVVYCLKGVSFRAFGGFLPELIAGIVVAISYMLKKNTLLSIISGTVCYMLLVQFIFI